jgi:hypothetical protein
MGGLFVNHTSRDDAEAHTPRRKMLVRSLVLLLFSAAAVWCLAWLFEQYQWRWSMGGKPLVSRLRIAATFAERSYGNSETKGH